MQSCAADLQDGNAQHGPTVEAFMVLLLREAYHLAADYAHLRGQEAVATRDIVRALKVLAHPTCDFLDALAAPTRAEHAAGSKQGLERAVEAIESCALALSAERVAVEPGGEAEGADVLRICGEVKHNKYLGLMEGADALFVEAEDKEDGEDEEVGADRRWTPMRRAVLAGVKAMLAHWQARQTQQPEQP